MPRVSGSASFLAALLFPFFGAEDLEGQVRDSTRSDTSVIRIGEINVRASRPVTTTGGASAIEVRLDSMALPPAPTLEQVLRELPMMHVRTNSRGEAEITLRGSESRQVAVLLDGVPLTLGWDARTDVSVLPATAPRELTLIRGLSSVLYGPNVLGGIVLVGVGHGPAGGETRSLSVTAGVDDFGGLGTSASLAVPHRSSGGDWLFRAGGGYRDLPGVPLADGVVEPVPADDDLRLNTDVREFDGFGSVRYTAEGGGWFSVSGSGFSAERGIAAELGATEPRLWRYPAVSRFIAVASGGTGERRTPFGSGDIEASFGLDAGHSEIDAFASRAYDEVVEEEDGDDRTYTLRLLADHTLGPRGDLRAAFTYADINHEEFLTPGGSASYRQRLWSLGGESEWRLVERAGALDALRFSAGAALDVGDTPETGDKPALDRLTDWGARAGVTATLGGGATLLHAGISRRARFPSLRELYSGALGRFEPNPELTPERLLAMEAGVTARIGRGELQAVAFRHRLSDAIVRIGTPDGKRKRVNRDRINSAGLELLASARFGPLGLAADLTLQNVDLVDPEASSSRRPENMPEILGGIDARVALPFDLRASLDARYTGEQFCLDPDTGADRRLDDGTRVDLDLARTWTVRPSSTSWFTRLEARIGVVNAGDVAIHDSCGLPRPGRLFQLQLRLF